MSKFEFSYEIYESYDQLPPADKDLFDYTKAKLENAYAPYSNFPVVASAEMANGDRHFACNQENASYPLCTCAEQALLSFVGSNYPNTIIRKVAVLTSTLGNRAIPDTPCGACRQILIEHERRQNHSIQILAFSLEGKQVVLHKAVDLLPFAFDLK